MLSLSDNNQAGAIELQLNKANSFDTEAPFLNLDLSIMKGIVSSKIYDKRYDFNVEIMLIISFLAKYRGSYIRRSYFIELIKRVEEKEIKCEACRAFYLFFASS